MPSNFSKRKKDILLKKDKSSKGNWDKKIVDLCGKINALPNCYTTSSCAGRIVLIVDDSKKRQGLFRFVSHELITLNQLKNELLKIAESPLLISKLPARSSQIDKISNKKILMHSKLQQNSDFSLLNPNQFSRQRDNLLIKFKSEPPILHVGCRDLEDAFGLLKKAREVGWKRSGIISRGRRYVVELISTEKLEFPIIDEGKILVDDLFLKLIVKKANENLKNGWQKIQRFEKLL